MFQKHIKAVSFVLVLCLIAVMFMIVALVGNSIDGANPASEVMLFIFVAVACVSVFAAHEKHD